MSVKGFFNKGESEENEKNRQIELEKQVRRINTLEVHLNRLLKLEAKIGPLLTLKEQLEAAQKKHSFVTSDPLRRNSQKEFLAQNKEIEKINRRLENLEQKEQQNNHADSFPTFHHSNESVRSHSDQLQELQLKIKGLETNLALVNQIQIDILTQLDVSRKQWSELEEFFKEPKTEGQPVVQPKEIYIDKFFLDKYEQNNNIEQVGIKELSGVLNIGATYGTIPLQGGADTSSEQEEADNGEANSTVGEPHFTATEGIYSDIPIEDPAESNEDSPES
ncbi:hypothetical protein ACQYAD_11295 [Neobacillus sp. SM06]|uniref:hypothetical protein n=1 Tax=Neobacillus sp. SM06 TaxID=3422492 RepID=UPI003D2D01DA